MVSPSGFFPKKFQKGYLKKNLLNKISPNAPRRIQQQSEAMLLNVTRLAEVPT
jgi:hypothetical protein